MLNIKKCDLNIKYERNIEGMGEWLVLLEIKVKITRSGANYHIFYRDGKKPPFDVALNPIIGTVEYLSFFLMNEKVTQQKPTNMIKYEEHNIGMINPLFSEKNDEINETKEFDILFYDNNITTIEKNETGELTGYKLGENNYILLNHKNEIVGASLKNITLEELRQLKESKVL